ncbi:prephenate dehydrogenase/arogenate dehydrogenase family protein, partial [Gammaproteobacteria bacterium]|nr:prephenate dehydrogenase/arogenate dehydrogenase family protein [Gammaproteobacteria bacterium]
EINNKELIGKIDLIIVAVSPRVTQSVISSLKSLWNTDITITETSSVKNHLNFDSPNNLVFSHPIAGSDKSGISYKAMGLTITPCILMMLKKII